MKWNRRNLIHADCSESSKLVERLLENLMLEIVNNSRLIFDAGSGFLHNGNSFLTFGELKEADNIISNIYRCNQFNDMVESETDRLVSRYLEIVPQEIPDQKLNPFSNEFDISLLRLQFHLLDKIASFSPQRASERGNTFTRIGMLYNEGLSQTIRKFYESSAHAYHFSARFKIKHIYEICIDSMHLDYSNCTSIIGNETQLWHGTPHFNLISILKFGLRLPETIFSNSSTGRMFGDGLYFFDVSTKALNYSCGHWQGTYTNNPFLLLCDVSLGRQVEPVAKSQFAIDGSFDSIVGKAGNCNLRNNEMVVFRTSQVSPVCLIEFTDSGYENASR